MDIMSVKVTNNLTVLWTVQTLSSTPHDLNINAHDWLFHHCAPSSCFCTPGCKLTAQHFWVPESDIISIIFFCWGEFKTTVSPKQSAFHLVTPPQMERKKERKTELSRTKSPIQPSFSSSWRWLASVRTKSLTCALSHAKESEYQRQEKSRVCLSCKKKRMRHNLQYLIKCQDVLLSLFATWTL